MHIILRKTEHRPWKPRSCQSLLDTYLIREQARPFPARLRFIPLKGSESVGRIVLSPRTLLTDAKNMFYYNLPKYIESSTYGHSQLKTGHPVRSAIHKQLNGRLVLRWVTTWESLLLYVLHSLLLLQTLLLPQAARATILVRT
jgi:hypothetical protein